MKHMESIFVAPQRERSFYGIKDDRADKKVRFQNRRGRFEYHIDKWHLRLAGRKQHRKNNADAATLQYPKTH